MGEKQNGPFQLSFNPSFRIEFQGSRVTFDGGLILVRELDERLGFRELIHRHLTAEVAILPSSGIDRLAQPVDHNRKVL